MSKNLDIQVLRGVAILFVVLFHIPGKIPVSDYLFSIITSNGFQVGVDLFFVISGYVITNSLLRMGSLSAGECISRQDWFFFWKKRGYRLLPAFVFWVFIGLISIPIMGVSKEELGLNALFSAYGLLGIYNIVDAYCGAYGLFGVSCPEIEVTRVYWSLSLEAQFYAVVSLSLLIVGIRRFLVYSAGLFLLFLIIFTYSKWGQDFLYIAYSVLIRSCGLFFGCFIAFQKSTGQLVVLQKIPSYIKLTFMGSGLMAIPILGGYGGLLSTLVASIVCYVIVVLSVEGGVLSKYRVGQLLIWVGERSYSIYLSHVIVLYLAGDLIYMLFEVNNSIFIELTSLIIVFIGIMTVGHLSYSRIEARFFVRQSF